METGKSSFAKQYAPTATKVHYRSKVQNIPSIPFHVPFDHVINVSKCSAEKCHPHSCGMIQSEIRNEEIIDLTCSSKENHVQGVKVEDNGDRSSSSQDPGIVVDPNSMSYPKRRRKRRKFAYTADGKLVLIPNDETLQSPASFSESKQLEILKAAKSLFSKRTRTLYHWMYPNAAKLQIKAAVTSSWESLGTQEKDFYISQVLGRFGFPQSSLMVNPQLGGIKELPLIAEATETKSKSRELQSAISSIMPENPMPPDVGSNSLTFEEFEEINELTKKRRGRPPGSSSKKHKYGLAGGPLAQDFKDDPELSQELEQFATMFNLSKI